jgi:hypothetical protein
VTTTYQTVINRGDEEIRLTCHINYEYHKRRQAFGAVWHYLDRAEAYDFRWQGIAFDPTREEIEWVEREWSARWWRAEEEARRSR